MPRQPRLDFEDTTHHAFHRGDGKEPIFLDDADRRYFLRRLRELQRELRFKLLAFCLMGNHFHLALKRGLVPMHKIMHRLLTSHARAFNDRWVKVGHTFQGRYGSRPIRSDADLMGIIRYIHLNPVEAGIAATPEAWPWSSHADLIARRSELIDVDFVLGLFGGVDNYLAFMKQPVRAAERPSLDALAGAEAELLKGASRTTDAIVLRRRFVEEALRCGWRRSDVAAYLGRTRGAVTLLLQRS